MHNTPIFCLSSAPSRYALPTFCLLPRPLADHLGNSWAHILRPQNLDTCRQLPEQTWTILQDKHPTPPRCSATSTENAVNSGEGCPGYHGHAWPITYPHSRGRLTERRVPNPPARRHSPCPLPSGPSVHHLLQPLSLAAGLPPPSCLALLPLIPLSSLFCVASPSRCHPSRLPSSLLWVTVTVTVTWLVCLSVDTLS